MAFDQRAELLVHDVLHGDHTIHTDLLQEWDWYMTPGRKDAIQLLQTIEMTVTSVGHPSCAMIAAPDRHLRALD